MKSYKAFLFVTVLACLSLTSCYHEFANGGGGGGGGGNNGNAFINVTVTSTPSPTFAFQSLIWQVGSMSLITSTGTSTSIGGGAGSPFLDFVRLQTDSAYLGHATIAATSYTQLNIVFNPPLFNYFYNNASGTVLGCAAGTVCLIPSTVVGLGSTNVTVPITYSATANTNSGIRINFDLSKAVSSTGGMSFDFTQPGAITLSTLPPALSSQTSGLDTVDNFTGVVTAASGNSVTASSFFSQPRTFAITSSTEFDDPFNLCALAGAGCLAVNQNISLDGVINADGTTTATEIEFLDPAPAVGELEGIIISPFSNNQFKMILTNGMGSSTLTVSTELTVNLTNAPVFLIDPKDLGISDSPLGFQSSSDLVAGQTVMLQGGTLNGSTGTLSNPARVLLRYSIISGSVQTPGNPIFTLGSISPFLTNLVSNSAQVDTFPNTAFDNISSVDGLATGTNASVRALYLNPNSGAAQPLLAAKIRTH